MNRILENLISEKISLKKETDYDFNLKSIYNKPSFRDSDFYDVPIEPKESRWSSLDGKLSKQFVFKTTRHLLYFINELVEKANIINHEPEIIINGLTVNVTTYTQDFGDVTELDLDIANYSDELYGDITYINRDIDDDIR